MAWSGYKQSYGFASNTEEKTNTDNNINILSQTSPLSSKASKSKINKGVNNNNNNNNDQLCADDFFFLLVQDWSKCSRCLWHYEHVLDQQQSNEGIIINPNVVLQKLNNSRSQSTIYTNNNGNNPIQTRSSQFNSQYNSQLHSPNIVHITDEDIATDESDTGPSPQMSYPSLSPLRLSQQQQQQQHQQHNSYIHKTQSQSYSQSLHNTNSQNSPHLFPPNKKCDSSPLTPSLHPEDNNHTDIHKNLQLEQNMVKSRSLPNIQDAMSPPFNTLISPNELHFSLTGNHNSQNRSSYHHSPSMTHYSQFKYTSKQSMHRQFNIMKKDELKVAKDNVIPIGYGSLKPDENSIMNLNRECKDNNNNNNNNINNNHHRSSTPKILELNTRFVTQNTSLRFIYESYRIVITLDISSSIGVMNPTTRCVTFEHYYPMLRDFLKLISEPIEFDYLAVPISPKLYICIIAVGLPDKPLITLINEEIVCSRNRKPINALIKKLYDEFQKLEQKCVQQLVETHKKNTRLNVDWEDIIHHSLFCLDRMPSNACPNIVVITDGILTLEQHTGTYGGGVLAQVLRRDVSVNTLQSCERQFAPNTPFGHVPDSDLLEFFCRFTNGILLDHKTLHQQRSRQQKRFKHIGIIDDDKADQDNEVIKDRYNKTLINDSHSHSEYDQSFMNAPFHHYKNDKFSKKVNREEADHDNDDEDDDEDDDDPLGGFMSSSLYQHYDSKFTNSEQVNFYQQNKIINSIPAKWFRNKVDSLFKEDNLVQLGVLVRSSSLSNQVFESSASSMLASWSVMVESATNKKNNMLLANDENRRSRVRQQSGIMGHFDRVQWYKTSYNVQCPRELIIRARTNEGFKNANIVRKGDYGYYQYGQYANSDQSSASTLHGNNNSNLVDIIDDTSSVESHDSKYLLENNQIVHMFHEWKHRVVIEYQMIFAHDGETRVNVFIISSKTFLANLVKYLSQKNINTGQQVIMQRSQQFAELEEFIHDIKKTDKALSKLVIHEPPKTLNQQRKLSTLLNYLEDRIWHDVIFQDVICLPKDSYIDVFDKSPVRIQKHIEKMQMETPDVWMKVREGLKQWASFDLEYNSNQYDYGPEMIKYVRTYPETRGFAIVVYEQPCDWLISLKIETQGPGSRRSHVLIKDSVVKFIQQTVQLAKHELKFLDKPIHNLLVLDFPDCNKCNNSSSEEAKLEEPPQYHPHIHIDSYYQQEVQLIRSYLHTNNWFCVMPQSCIVYVMSMFTDLKLREGFKLIMNHPNGRILGHWIHSTNSRTETSFVQLNINKKPKGLHIELAIEPTLSKHTFNDEKSDQDESTKIIHLSTTEILQELSKWTEKNMLKILSIVASLYASFRTIKEQTRIRSRRRDINDNVGAMNYHSDSDSDEHNTTNPSLTNTNSSSSKALHANNNIPFPKRQMSTSELLTPAKRRSLRRDKKKPKMKLKSKRKTKGLSLGRKKRTTKQSDKPKLRRHISELSPQSSSMARVAGQQRFTFNDKSALSNDDLFDGCGARYKAKLDEINLFSTKNASDLASIMAYDENKDNFHIDDKNQNKVTKKSLDTLQGILEILQHSKTNHRVFPYELDYHQQILNEEKSSSQDTMMESTKSKVRKSAQLLSKLLLRAVKRVSDIEIIPNKVYCCGNPRESNSLMTKESNYKMDDNLLYIVLPSFIHSEQNIDNILSKIKPINHEKSNNCNYLHLFEVSKQIVSMTTSSSLYDPKEYGIIAQIMKYPTNSQLFQKRPIIDQGKDEMINQSLSLTKRSVTDSCLPRLRQEHDRNKARIIYFDLLNKINVPMSKIEYAIDKCCQYREDFNISLLKKLMIAQFDAKNKNTENSTQETKNFANELRNAIESTCKSQFKYISELDAYFYIPPGYKHKFLKETTTEKIEEEEEEEDDDHVDNEEMHSSSANDADDNESEDDIDGSESSGGDEDQPDNIPISEAEKLKTVDKSSAQERRMYRAKLRGMREKKSALIIPNSSTPRKAPNMFNSILCSINSRYNQSAESLIIATDQTASAPPPEAFASPFSASPPTPNDSMARLKRTTSSPVGTRLFEAINDCINDQITPEIATPSSLPYPLFIRFNVIIHGTANRFRSVSINDINEEVLYTQQASAICLNAIIMTTPPNIAKMDTSLVSLEDIDSLSMNEFNDAPYLHSSHSMTSLSGHQLRNATNILPALDTQNIRKLPGVFVGLYRRFSKKLRAHIAQIILNELRGSRPINSEIILQQLSLLEPHQYHLFSHKIRFVGERCFQLLPQYMTRPVMSDIKLEYFKVNLSQLSQRHHVNMWYALKADLKTMKGLKWTSRKYDDHHQEGKEPNDDQHEEGKDDGYTIPYWVLICIPEENKVKIKTPETGRESNVSFLMHINSKHLSSYKVDQIEQKFRDCIDQISFNINQQALLQKLNETREPDNWLIPPPTQSTIDPTYKEQHPISQSSQHSDPSDSLVFA